MFFSFQGEGMGVLWRGFQPRRFQTDDPPEETCTAGCSDILNWVWWVCNGLGGANDFFSFPFPLASWDD